jgi:hypothetical protein
MVPDSERVSIVARISDVGAVMIAMGLRPDEDLVEKARAQIDVEVRNQTLQIYQQ